MLDLQASYTSLPYEYYSTDLKIFGARCARNLLEKVRLTRVSNALWCVQMLSHIARKDPIQCRYLCSVGTWKQSHPEDLVTYVLLLE